MTTATIDRPTADMIATPDPIGITRHNDETVEKYVPWGRHAPRSANRIAMHARREQDYRQSGW